MSVQSQIIALV